MLAKLDTRGDGVCGDTAVIAATHDKKIFDRFQHIF
jgi:hypothetical protein